MTLPQASEPNRSDANRDLGFGGKVASESRRRLLNRDGSFNVRREGLGFFQAVSPYHSLLTIPWGPFLALLAAAYLFINAVFAIGYLLCGPGALFFPSGETTPSRFLDAFFFSVQTYATIGYGSVHPVGLAANVLVTLESLIGILTFALATGIIFARFSGPSARLRLSRHGVIAPYQGITAFMFRVANTRNNEVIDLECQVVFSRFESRAEQSARVFHRLDLERSKVTFLPLAWTVVHPIDERSPLRGETEESLRASGAEFLILLKGTEETTSHGLHVRSSYEAHELAWNSKFRSVFLPPDGDGRLRVDLTLLDQVEPA
jgi:inward rectifier potassium channel